MRLIVFNDPHRGFSDKSSKVHDKVFASIDQSSFDVVVVCGDWGATKMDHVRGSFKAFRRAFPDKPIVGVIGNHDYWDAKIKMTEKFDLIKKFALESNIHLLQNNPFEKDGVLIMGFDGWYHHPHPDTNDSSFMNSFVNGKSVDNYLKDEADAAVNFMIDYPKEGKKVVSVTHFPCIEESMDMIHWNGNPMHGTILMEFSDLILFGHTHQAFDQVIGKSRVLNVGSGYNQLIYKIVEV